MNKLLRKLSAALATKCAPLVVMDNHGSKIYVWTAKDARQWLSFCSPVAVVYNRYTKSVVMRRWISAL